MYTYDCFSTLRGQEEGGREREVEEGGEGEEGEGGGGEEEAIVGLLQ